MFCKINVFFNRGQNHIAKRDGFLFFSSLSFTSFLYNQPYKAFLAAFLECVNETTAGTVQASHRGTPSKHGQGVSCVHALQGRWGGILAFWLDSHWLESTNQKKKKEPKNPTKQ